MSTPIRIDLPNLVYHIYCRGNNKSPIFHERRDYQRFLSKLKEYKDKFKVKIHAFCLLPNHFHLLIEPLKTGVKVFMHPLMTSYAKYFSFKYEVIGHIWQERFQSIIVDKDNYFLTASKYIHLNPVKSGIVNDPYTYEWSSCASFSSEKEDSLIIKVDTLSYFSSNTEKAIIKYKEFLTYDDKVIDVLKEAKRGVLGKRAFFHKLGRMVGKII